MKVAVLLFLLGVAAGYGFSRKSPLAVVRPATTPRHERPAVPRSPVPKALSREEWSNQAADWLAKVRQPDFSPYSEHVADWSVEEIRRALDEALKDPDCVLANDSSWSGGGVLSVLFAEFMNRDLEQAIAWFDSIKIETAKSRMALDLSYRWPAEHAARGLEFVISHKDLFPHGTAWSILLKNMESTAKIGPVALGALIERIASEGLDLSFGNQTRLPGNFDYAAFVKTRGFLENKNETAVSLLLAGWMAANRETAFDYYLSNGDTAKLAEQIPDTGNRAEYLTWLGGKVSSLAPEQATELVDAVNRKLVFGFPTDADHFIAHMENQSLREKIIAESARAIFQGEVESTLKRLETIQDPAKRVDILASMVPRPAYLQAPSRRPVGETESALLRKKLDEWGANEAQTTQILTMIQR